MKIQTVFGQYWALFYRSPPPQLCVCYLYESLVITFPRTDEVVSLLKWMFSHLWKIFWTPKDTPTCTMPLGIGYFLLLKVDINFFRKKAEI